MDLAQLKPWLTALVMPPASLLVLLALALLLRKRWRKFSKTLAVFAFAALWLLSTKAFAVWLATVLLPQYAPVDMQTLTTQGAQAIAVLGGGIEFDNPEYGQTTLDEHGYERLRYGYYLKAKTGLPLGYTGGYGWSSRHHTRPPMQDTLQTMTATDGRAPLDWVEGQSRDTRENARFTAQLLQPQGIRTIVIVTHAYHMPRSVRAFEAAGFKVIAAPMGFTRAADTWQAQWLPTGKGMQASYSVLRERLGLWMQAY